MKLLKNKKMLLTISFIILIGVLSFYLLFITHKNMEKDLTKIGYPKTYRELYNLIKSKNYNYNGEYNQGTDDLEGKNSIDYSKTNVQVSGVDEADIVKTDGEYIYSISGEYLYIVKAIDGNMEIVSKIKAPTNNQENNYKFSEMYIKDNKLIVLMSQSYYAYDSKEFIPDYFTFQNGEVAVIIYDVTDKTKPIKLNELSQSGYYISSRMVDNYLYITTNYYVYNDISIKDEKTFVPTLKGTETRSIPIDDIIVAPNPSSSSYLTVTGIDINNASDFVSSKAILGSSSNLYADADNIYIAGYVNEITNNIYTEKTSLIKFSCKNGILNLVASGTVNGYILNQFSMDESNGYFRIATTSNNYTYSKDDNASTSSIDIGGNKSNNNLYVLDNELKVVSKIEGLAEGERIYSVRFDGNILYFVTFKQVDPLFVVDLSNPKNPVIKSELKIPGFSEYLHVYNEKYLFGLGKEANSEGRVIGMKISMYDISDKTNVVEKYRSTIGDQYSWSESSYNHKAILVSTDKELIAFPVNNYYVVYKFKDGVGFEKIGQIDFDLSKDTYYYYYGNIRGLYINDYLYVVNQKQIKTMNIQTLTLGNVLELN